MTTSKKRALLAFTTVVITTLLVFFLSPWGEPFAPIVTIRGYVETIGAHKEIEIEVTDKQSGLSFLDVAIIQSGKKHSLLLRDFDDDGHTDKNIVSLVIKAAELGLTEGNATLRVLARDRSLWQSKTLLLKETKIDITPPRLALLSGSPNNVRPAGAAVVVYEASKPLVNSGVIVGNSTYRGFLEKSGKNNIYVAYFALPLESVGKTKAGIFAEDAAGNRAQINIPLNVMKKSFRHDWVTVSNEVFDKVRGLEKKYYTTSGLNNEDTFKMVNNDVRDKSDIRVKKICSVSSLQRLWKGTFLRMHGSASKANFGDRRTYTSGGKILGKSVHLGVDLASTTNAPIEAANTGVVVFCGDLGIYGNSVIIDHGQGLFSLYAHLDRIDTSEDSFVKKGDFIGKSGVTGLAVGDHLHFSILVAGDFVDPTEWWDENWVSKNIEDKLR